MDANQLKRACEIQQALEQIERDVELLNTHPDSNWAVNAARSTEGVDVRLETCGLFVVHAMLTAFGRRQEELLKEAESL